MVGCAHPDPSPPLEQPSSIEIKVKGADCNVTFDAANRKCHDAVMSVKYNVVVNDKGWITKVRMRLGRITCM